ncbi:sensor histidine kinase [Paenibacillus cymbidii]|uniref:sensor histidine kinase n=1 Tax=Paenibacillus cymbidii TaxID=1639034 RepID=UPI00108036B8|nr:HAMP domain-containing sensor histidine kinase [Paenibacillus cymbidii]
MIRSLYVRVVLTFLLSVIAGIIVAFFVATAVFQEKVNVVLTSGAISFGLDTARIYESLPGDEADKLLGEMKQLESYYVRIYDREGLRRTFGQPGTYDPAVVTPEMIDRVLGGEVSRDNPKNTDPFVVGVPLHTNGGTQALFVQPIYPSVSLLVQWILTILAYSLAAGSIFILIAAVFLVRPLKKLTKATRRLAAGDFNVKLNIKQKDELGKLARSFEDMTHELRQLEQMRRDFVSNVSHEVRSPLTSISGYAKALKQVDLPDAERNRYLDIIIAESDRVSSMSDSLLKLAMLEAQHEPLRPVTFRLDEQIRRVIVALQPTWSPRGIRFELELPNAIVTADQDQWNQIWTNLIGNSIKFSPDGGAIAVSIEPGITTVVVRIADRGIGISPEDRKRVFERFFKADRSHSRKYGGSGLGLAIVKQIVSLHQGEIQVESEPGCGTTFIVTLPSAPSLP